MATPRAPLPPKVPGPAILQTIASLFFADRFDAYMFERYPATMRMRIVGVGEVVATRDPDVARGLFTAPPGTVVAGEINRRVLPVLGDGSVMAADGDRHLRMR